MPYTYDYPKVADLTASFVLFTMEENEVYVLLGKRKATAGAYPGSWCLPGGFMEVGELSRQTACRELFEETGVRITNLQFDSNILFVDVFETLNRDPRGRVFDLAYTTILDKNPKTDTSHPECDLEEVAWFPLYKIYEMLLAFDHVSIVDKAFDKIEPFIPLILGKEAKK